MPARGFEGIRKRTDRKVKPWEARFNKTYADGTTKRVSLYGESRDEVRDLRDRERQAKKRSGSRAKITVERFLQDTWLPAIAPVDGVAPAKPRVRRNTYEQRKVAVARLVAAPVSGRPLGRMLLDKVVRSDVIALFDAMEQNEPKKGRARQIAFEVLRVAMNFALDRDLIEANPTVRVVKPGHRTKPQRHLSETEVFRLLSTAEQRIIGDNGRERYYAFPI